MSLMAAFLSLVSRDIAKRKKILGHTRLTPTTISPALFSLFSSPGLFISDLAVNDAFPSFIDPSCPSSVPETDSTGALVRLSKPDAFDHLQPLPPGVKLEPLINLYKFRVTAMTIKTVLAFQERAKAYKYEADGGVYVKCLKIRCLSGEQMTQ